jgi:hypothetical protein
MQELRQQEDCDERNYWAPSVAEIRLVHQHRVGNGGRVGEGERRALVGVIPRIVREYGGGDGGWRVANNIDVREGKTN